ATVPGGWPVHGPATVACTRPARCRRAEWTASKLLQLFQAWRQALRRRGDPSRWRRQWVIQLLQVDYFAAVTRDQGPEQHLIDALRDESHRTVAERGKEPVGIMPAQFGERLLLVVGNVFRLRPGNIAFGFDEHQRDRRAVQDLREFHPFLAEENRGRAGE